MRPCQNCNASLMNHQRTCPACGASQAPTIGTNASDPRNGVDQDLRMWPERELNRFDGVLVAGLQFLPMVLIVLLAIAGFLTGGGGGMLIGAGLAFIACMCAMSFTC